MDIRLDQGDFAVGVNGLPGSVRSREGLLRRALVRLTIPRGSFPHSSELDSRLYTPVMSSADLSMRACELAGEALAALPGASVEQVVYTPLGGGYTRLMAELSTSLDLGIISLEPTGQEG